MVAPLRKTREGRDKLASCVGKDPFPTKAAALLVARRLGNAHAFRCQHCHQFHIGHNK